MYDKYEFDGCCCLPPERTFPVVPAANRRTKMHRETVVAKRCGGLVGRRVAGKGDKRWGALDPCRLDCGI